MQAETRRGACCTAICLGGSRHRDGQAQDWLKFKNPDAPAVKREAEED
jgi:hypothetical protein